MNVHVNEGRVSVNELYQIAILRARFDVKCLSTGRLLLLPIRRDLDMVGGRHYRVRVWI